MAKPHDHDYREVGRDYLPGNVVLITYRCRICGDEYTQRTRA